MNDKELLEYLIEKEGSLTKLSKKLNVSTQRINNWRHRRIPAEVKLEYPKIFLPHFRKKSKTPSGN